MDFNLSDFPTCKEMFDSDDDVEADSRHAVLPASGDFVPPSNSNDSNRNVSNPNSSCQIPRAGLDSNYNPRDDLKSQDQTSGTDQHEAHDVAGGDSKKVSINENIVKDGPPTVHRKVDDGTFLSPSLQRLRVSEEARNPRPTPSRDMLRPGTKPPAPTEPQELEIKSSHGRIFQESGLGSHQLSVALLTAGGIMLLNEIVQELFSVMDLYRLRDPADSPSAVSRSYFAVTKYGRHAPSAASAYAIRGIYIFRTLLRQFLLALRGLLPDMQTIDRMIYSFIAVTLITLFLSWRVWRSALPHNRRGTPRRDRPKRP